MTGVVQFVVIMDRFACHYNRCITGKIILAMTNYAQWCRLRSMSESANNRWHWSSDRLHSVILMQVMDSVNWYRLWIPSTDTGYGFRQLMQVMDSVNWYRLWDYKWLSTTPTKRPVFDSMKFYTCKVVTRFCSNRKRWLQHHVVTYEDDDDDDDDNV